jgi:hypothetical protein
MSKFNPSSTRLSIDQGKKVLSSGIYLGRSRMEKDCYWSCHQYEGNYYISLNSWQDSVWEADEDDIKLYCDLPS